jgi:hypothetical protein
MIANTKNTHFLKVFYHDAHRFFKERFNEVGYEGRLIHDINVQIVVQDLVDMSPLKNEQNHDIHKWFAKLKPEILSAKLVYDGVYTYTEAGKTFTHGYPVIKIEQMYFYRIYNSIKAT